MSKKDNLIKMHEIDSKICDIEIKMNYVSVMLDDLLQSYFDVTINDKEDLWYLGEPYLSNARAKTEITYNIVLNLKRELQNLSAVVEENWKQI